MKVPSFLFAVLFLLGSAARGDEPPVDQKPSSAETTRVGVFYATNRKHMGGRSPAKTFGGDRGDQSFGRCEVAFTAIPLINQMAPKVPFHVPAETNAVRVVEQQDLETFLERVESAAAATSSGSVVLFVHGYNYGFARTCRMAAELQRDLEGRAVVVMFSWPANGVPTDYVRDQADMEWSVPFLASLLDRLGERVGRDKVQLLAHSLGTRGAVMALQRLGADRGEGPVVARLVLLAPDFDSETFLELLPRLRPLAGGITLYASENDTPLKVSRQLSGYPRLGQGGELLALAPGMETIDVSGAGRYQILGHEYFYYHPLVAADLAELLSTGRPAGERPGVVPRTRSGGTYWEPRWADTP